MSQEPRPPPPPSSSRATLHSILLTVVVLSGLLLIWISEIVQIYGPADAAKIGFVLGGLGEMIASSALIWGGILCKDIDKFVRFGMLIAAGLIILAMQGLGIRAII